MSNDGDRESDDPRDDEVTPGEGSDSAPPERDSGRRDSSDRRIGFQIPGSSPSSSSGGKSGSGTGGADTPVPSDPNDPLAGLLAAMLGGGGLPDLGGTGPGLPPDLLANLPPGLLNLPGMPQDPQALQQMLSSV